jgi:hypothetical protein
MLEARSLTKYYSHTPAVRQVEEAPDPAIHGLNLLR